MYCMYVRVTTGWVITIPGTLLRGHFFPQRPLCPAISYMTGACTRPAPESRDLTVLNRFSDRRMARKCRCTLFDFEFGCSTIEYVGTCYHTGGVQDHAYVESVSTPTRGRQRFVVIWIDPREFPTVLWINTFRSPLLSHEFFAHSWDFD